MDKLCVMRSKCRGVYDVCEDNSQFWIFLSTFLVTCYFALDVSGWVNGRQYDYGYYQEIWSWILDGNNPWEPFIDGGGGTKINAYGPAFSWLSIVYAVHPIAPQILGSFLFYSVSFYVSKSFEPILLRWLFAIFVCLNPYIFLFGSVFGYIDQMVVALLMLSIVAFRRKIILFSAIAFSFTVLTKFFPAMFVAPFFRARDRDAIRFCLFTAIILALVMLCYFGLYGRDVFFPLEFGSSRGVGSLSIYRLPDIGYSDALRDLANRVNMFAVAAFGFFLVFYRREFKIFDFSRLLFVFFMTLKVVYFHYYLSLLMFLAWDLFEYSSKTRKIPVFTVCLFLAFCGWISFFATSYLMTYSFSFGNNEFWDLSAFRLLYSVRINYAILLPLFFIYLIPKRVLSKYDVPI